MGTPRVYGPYRARNGYRMVVVEGTARKSIVVASLAAGAQLKEELERALLQRSDRPVTEALTEYQDYLLHVRGAVTAQHIARAIARFLGNSLTLGALTASQAAALYEAETRRVLDGKDRFVAAASHRTVLGQCKRFYAWAVQRGYVQQNPFASVKPVGKPNTGKSQLRIDEARQFVAVALQKAEAGDRAATCALLALLLGMRASEVLHRVVRDLDDQGRVLWITRGKTDNARRRLQVPEVLRPLLLRYAEGKAPEQLLFQGEAAGRQQPPSDAWLWGQVQRLCDEAGVPRVSTHSLRGLHSTLALEAGATGGAVAAALGHGSFAVTAKHYAAPGTMDRVRSKVVEEALRSPPNQAVEEDFSEMEAAALLRAVERLPKHLRAELRKALAETPNS